MPCAGCERRRRELIRIANKTAAAIKAKSDALKARAVKRTKPIL